MPDKRRERFYFQALRKALNQFPDGGVSECEPPDFVITQKNRRLGIEFTVFHLPPSPGERPHQEQQSLKDQVAELAQRYHQEAGGPALYVSIFFLDKPPLHRRDVEPLARKISQAVMASKVPTSIDHPMVIVSWDQLPNGIASMHMHGSIDGEDRLWHADAGGWVAPILPDHVAQVIKTKARGATLARTRCDELWLVIVNDPFSRAAPAEISQEVLKHGYEHPFDRLIWLLPHSPRTFDLRKKDDV